MPDIKRKKKGYDKSCENGSSDAGKKVLFPSKSTVK